MGTEAPTTIVIPVHCAPKKAPCPKCGKLGRRKRTCTRSVRTVAYNAIVFLEITYGEYGARCECSTTFRNTPEGVLPKALYDNRVRDLVLEGLIPKYGDTEIFVGLGLARTSPEEQHGVVVRWKCGSSRKSKWIGTRGMASVVVRTVPQPHRHPQWWTRRDAC